MDLLSLKNLAQLASAHFFFFKNNSTLLHSIPCSRTVYPYSQIIFVRHNGHQNSHNHAGPQKPFETFGGWNTSCQRSNPHFETLFWNGRWGFVKMAAYELPTQKLSMISVFLTNSISKRLFGPQRARESTDNKSSNQKWARESTDTKKW